MAKPRFSNHLIHWSSSTQSTVAGKYGSRPLNHTTRELSLKALARRIVLADRTLSVLMDYITDKRIIKLLCPYFSLILQTTKIWQRCESCFVLPERYTPPIITPYSRILFGYTDNAPELCGIKLWLWQQIFISRRDHKTIGQGSILERSDINSS